VTESHQFAGRGSNLDSKDRSIGRWRRGNATSTFGALRFEDDVGDRRDYDCDDSGGEETS
jgi:hypothetical protein